MRITPHRGILGIVVLGSLLIYAHTTARYGQALAVADAHLYYTHAHSWYFDGDCDYANNLAANPKLEVRNYYLAQRSPTGRVVNVFPCGWSVVALPFVVLADAVTALHNAVFDADVARDGFTTYYRTIVPLGHVLIGIAGLLAAYAMAARYFSRTIAASAAALVWLGTNVGYFIGIEPTLSHASSLGFVSLMIYAADTIHRAGWSLSRATGLGLSCGMMMAVRHQNFVWLIIPIMLLGAPAVAAAFRRIVGASSKDAYPRGLKPAARSAGTGPARRRAARYADSNLARRRTARWPKKDLEFGCSPKPCGDALFPSPLTKGGYRGVSDRPVRAFALAVLAMGIAAACLVPQVLVNLSTYGTVTSNLAEYAPDWLNPEVGRDLIANPGGLFVMYPLTAVALIGVIGWVWRNRHLPLARAVAVGFVALLYVNACAAGGPSRRYACCLVIWVLGLAAVMQWARRARWRAAVAAVLIGGFCLRNMAMIFLVDRGLLPRHILTAVPLEPPDVLGAMARWLAVLL
ncbi:MAG: hypothetical protein KJ749_05540 [Planctomycetes bacterium]|nr:hypothetical protein [Planctomycetota bacterium]